MDELVLIFVSVLLCIGAAYKWAKCVETTIEAHAIVLKGEQLKAVRSKSMTRNS